MKTRTCPACGTEFTMTPNQHSRRYCAQIPCVRERHRAHMEAINARHKAKRALKPLPPIPPTSPTHSAETPMPADPPAGK